MAAAREDVIANALNALSSLTSTSPLVLNDDGSVWVSVADGHDVQLSSGNRQIMCSCDWLRRITEQLGSIVDDESSVQAAMRSLIDGLDQSGDDVIVWTAGLKLIHLATNGNKFDTLTDEYIEPHIVLNTLMDSYYYGDYGDQLDENHTIESDRNKLSTQTAMFHLRSVIATIAIEKAVQSTKMAIDTKSTIRWIRLRSMVEDVISLFKKMLLNQVGLARESESEKGTQQTITMAAHIYVNYMLPACRDLLHLVLENASDQALITRISQTSYSCFSVLTSLAALDFIFDEGDVSASSTLLNVILGCISDANTDSLFSLIRSKQCSFGSSCGQLYKKKCFSLSNSIAIAECERGRTLLEDLLLYPSIRITYDFHLSTVDDSNDDDSDESIGEEQHDVYDSLGVAAIAHHALHTQTRENKFFSSVSKEQTWTLLFPHVNIFLSGMNNTSTTLSLLNEDELNETTAIETGVGMLEELISRSPTVVEPYSLATNSSSNESNAALYTMTLASTIESLLSTVMRLSMFEASMHNNPSANILKYSSQQVMMMTQTLLDFYSPIIRVQALLSLSHKMKYIEHSRVLLPRVLDWLRPVTMKQYADSNAAGLSEDTLSLILAVLDGLTPFMQDLEYTFDKSKLPLPKDTPEFMSLAESYTSLLSVFRSIRMWVYRENGVASIDEKFHQVERWIQENEVMLKDFTVLLSDLLDFWSRACSPRDAKVYLEENMEPPLGWHRLFLLLHAVEECTRLSE